MMGDVLKKDWLKGLIFACGIVFGISLFQTTPDGETLLHGFLGIFGIGSVLHIGAISFTVANFLLLSAMVVCFIYNRKYWKNYSEKFSQLNKWLYSIPYFAAAIIMMSFLWSLNPSIIDRIYFANLSRNQGIEAVTKNGHGFPLYINDTGIDREYRYAFTLTNHGNNVQEVYIYLAYSDFFSSDSRLIYNETPILDENGEPKRFMLFGAHSQFAVMGDFVTPSITNAIRSSSHHRYTVIIVDVQTGQRHEPTTVFRGRHGQRF
ncbi:MAG: hypothetical protein FWE33_01650 [Defluviitaleaceae bacterium]|nr:hypothetical protein [Defluviitaleaceae bacterium]